MNAPDPLDPPSAPGAPPWTAWAGLAAVVVLGIAAYANALGGAFVFDDVAKIRDNVMLRDLSEIAGPRGLALFRSRWVAFFTFALNYRAGGLSPVGYHAANVAIHLANAALVFALVALALRTPRLSTSVLAPARHAVAFVAAALFVAHPLQTQAVTYVVQRMTSLAALFYLAAVVLYLRWRLAGPRRSRAAGAVGYAAILAAALLAMKTKEIAFTLPFAVLLAEVSFFRTTRADLAALVPIALTALVVPDPSLFGGGAAAPGGLAALDAATRVQTTVGRLDYLATQLAVVVTYLFLLLVPLGQNVDHDYPISRSFLAPEVLSAALVLAALAGLAAWLFARTRDRAARPLDPAARLAAFGIAWWFLALSVESSVIPIVDVINEHRVYLPSAGLLAAARARPVAGARRTVAAGAALAVALGAATFARNRVWATDVALWTDAAKKSPDKSRPYLNLGTALREAGRTDAAAAALRRGVQLDPDSTYGRSQLGAVLLALGHRAEGEVELRAALARSPDDPEALFNLATSFWEQGHREDARFLYARFAASAPAAYAAAVRLATERAASGAGPSRDPAPELR
jgi:tetratricopeptide (TPR) repeat protein